MSAVLPPPAGGFPADVPVVIIGAGCAGLSAALACQEAGIEPLVVERDPLPRGSTALSAGLIPAPGSRWQAALGIADSPDLFVADVARKTKGKADLALARAIAEGAAPALAWLADRYGFPFSLVADFDYPGHSRRRLHGLPSRSGAELIDRLRAAAEGAGIPILTEAHADRLFADDAGRVVGVGITRPDGSTEAIGCRAVVLACSGYGGDKALVQRWIPSLGQALYFGHPGNTGDAVRFAEGLGLALADMTGHQGHGSVAHPAGILITWAVIMEGGFQVNMRGERFWNEAQGYSEAAEQVLAQPEGLAFDIFDARIAGIARQFEDFRAAEAAGAVLTAKTPAALAEAMKLPVERFLATFAAVEEAKRRGATDGFGRDWAGVPPLGPPLHAVRVTGALFHTQGGIVVEGATARALRADGSPAPNVFAAGGAARGISGPEASGYLSGNGLLPALVLGRAAGRSAAAVAAECPST
jgi:fumarate reductase flavoprotein subunit